MDELYQQLFSFAVKSRRKIVSFFKLFFFWQVFFSAVATWFSLIQPDTADFFYQQGINSGRLALIFYLLTTLPGITRRFGIKHKLVGILLLFRRYLGIAMFLFVLNHYWLVRGLNIAKTGKFNLSPPLFELMGTMAFLLVFPLFLTANDRSVRLLGVWWQRIHNLTYVIVFIIFFHVFLQRLSIWSVFIGITAFFQLTSHIYAFFKERRRRDQG